MPGLNGIHGSAGADLPTLARGIMLLLALLLALSNFSSVGFMRTSDDDRGSGIGGTGRTIDSATESGFGGTGFRPFVGMSSDGTELEVYDSPRHSGQALTATLDLAFEDLAPVTTAPLERLVTVIPEPALTDDSSPIDIREAIQRRIDVEVLSYQQLRENAQATLELPATPPVEQQPAARPASSAPDPAGDRRATVATLTHSATGSLVPDPTGDRRATVAADTASATATDPVPAPRQLTWSEVAIYLANNRASDEVLTTTNYPQPDNAELADSEESEARLDRPERIQRPELPPIQRVRPLIQRAVILPPRVRPLNL